MTPRCGPSRIQSLIFPRSRFTPATVAAWIRAHPRFSASFGLDVKPNTIRVRQFAPSQCCRSGGTIPIGKQGGGGGGGGKGKGIQAYVCPVKGGGGLRGLDAVGLSAIYYADLPVMVTPGKLNAVPAGSVVALVRANGTGEAIGLYWKKITAKGKQWRQTTRNEAYSGAYFTILPSARDLSTRELMTHVRKYDDGSTNNGFVTLPGVRVEWL